MLMNSTQSQDFCPSQGDSFQTEYPDDVTYIFDLYSASVMMLK